MRVKSRRVCGSFEPRALGRTWVHAALRTSSRLPSSKRSVGFVRVGAIIRRATPTLQVPLSSERDAEPEPDTAAIPDTRAKPSWRPSQKQPAPCGPATHRTVGALLFSKLGRDRKRFVERPRVEGLRCTAHSVSGLHHHAGRRRRASLEHVCDAALSATDSRRRACSRRAPERKARPEARQRRRASPAAVTRVTKARVVSRIAAERATVRRLRA
jgi:hypothetical protein